MPRACPQHLEGGAAEGDPSRLPARFRARADRLTPLAEKASPSIQTGLVSVRSAGRTGMVRVILGSAVAAIAMFIIGFIFFATPLQGLSVARIDDAQAAAVQRALAVNLPRTGTYQVP